MSTFDNTLRRRLRAVRAPLGFTADLLALTGLADRYVRAGSVAGDVFVAYNERGISRVALAGDEAQFRADFRALLGREAFASCEVPAGLLRALSGDVRAARKLRYDIGGLSEFAQAVLRKTLQIPRGEVRPYRWIAAEIASPKAVRAVGTALARNPVPLLIPCHRVVRTDGTIGEYALGSSNKRRILELEGVVLGDLVPHR